MQSRFKILLTLCKFVVLIEWIGWLGANVVILGYSVDASDDLMKRPYRVVVTTGLAYGELLFCMTNEH